jgi:hypothetical protein
VFKTRGALALTWYEPEYKTQYIPALPNPKPYKPLWTPRVIPGGLKTPRIYAAWGHVNNDKTGSGSSASTSSFTVNWNSNTTVGNRAFIVVEADRNAQVPTITSITDPRGNSWHQDLHIAPVDGSFDCFVDVWSAQITTQILSTDNLTVNIGNSIDDWVWATHEISGLDTSATPVDVKVSATNGTANLSPASGNTAATAAANEFVLHVYGDDGATDTWSAAPSGTAMANFMSSSVGELWDSYEDSGSSGSTPHTSGTLTPTNAIWGCGTVVYKLAPSGGVAIPTKPFQYKLIQPKSGHLSGTTSTQLTVLSFKATPKRNVNVLANVFLQLTASDSLGAISDTAVRNVQNFSRTASDSLSALSDTAVRNIMAFVRTASDTIGALSDTAIRNAMNFQRTASDNLGALSDTAIRNVMAFLRTASDSLSALSDSTVRVVTQPRTASDTLSALSDSAVRGVMSISRTASDTLSALSDSAIRNVMTFLRTASDTLGSITDVANEKVALPRTASDTLSGITESTTVQKGISRTASDALSALSDSAVRNAMSFQRTASDTLSALSDSAIRNIQNFIRTASDTLSGLTESTVTQKGVIRTASDTLSAISDSAIRNVMVINRTASDSLAALSDSAVRNVQSFIRTASDALSSITDSATRNSMSFIRIATDSLAAITDTTLRIMANPRTAADTINAISDVNIRNPQGFIRTAIDILNAILDFAQLPPKFFILQTQTIYTRDGIGKIDGISILQTRDGTQKINTRDGFLTITTRDGKQTIYTRDDKFTIKEG